MKGFAKTDVGKAREMNQDYYSIPSSEDDLQLYILADGMGGYNGGEIASRLAAETTKNYIQNNFEKIEHDKEAISKLIKDAIEYANMVVYEESKKDENLQGMGTTLVLSVITDDYILFGNVGDSSGFVMKKKVLYKVTKDHTLVNLLVESGELTKEEAVNHPRKNVLMRALGANNPIDVDIFDVDINSDAILLCSDGLTNMLTKEQIEKVLNSDLSLEEKIVKLVRKSNLRGGTDNVSIAYLERESGEDK